VGYWPGNASNFYCCINSDYGNLETSLFHELRVDLATIPESAFKATEGWTIDSRGTAAVWADGFQSFLNNPNALNHALAQLGVSLT